MENFLTKDKVKVILQNAPKGSNPEEIINALVSKGYKLEGFNDQPEKPKTMTGSDKATFQATGDEGLISGTLKTIGNVPSSALELGKNVAQAVTHPIETVKSVANLAEGVGAKVGQSILENTDFGQKLLAKFNTDRVSRGLEPLKQDTSGKFKTEDTPELAQLKQVGTFLADRYGSVDKFKETVIEDPAGVLADIATVFTGGGALLSKAGQVSKVSYLSRAGQAATAAGQAVEPINIISKSASAVKNVAKDSLPGRIVSEAVPTGTDIQKSQVVKALDLTQGDLANIGKKTGNDVTEFIISKDLIKDTPEAIAEALNDTRRATKELRNSEIKKVTTTYTPDQVPSIKQGLNVILEDVKDVVGLESEAKKIETLLKKENYTLEDVQLAKDMIDEQADIYTQSGKMGEVKSGKKAQGLANIRKGMKEFIEKEVDTATQGATNIKQLNNDIATSYAIEDAINTRATRGQTRQKISLGDSVVLFGGGATFSPEIGIGLYLGKKLIETPSFRLAFTKALNAQPLQNVKRIVSEVKNKNVSPETQKLIRDIAKQARNNLQIAESGAVIVDKSKSKKEK